MRPTIGGRPGAGEGRPVHQTLPGEAGSASGSGGVDTGIADSDVVESTSHVALTTWVAVHKGVSSAYFAFGWWYAFSTLLDDEFGVGWHRGFHAEILSKIVEDFFQGRPISHRKLKVLLGDPWLQIIAGTLLGISVTFICRQGFMGAA
ncbi:hypothetical protein MRB53_032371 [Persea americana]|uniref:Uncharacterized protein n=1 Tax=Persea americana TaxID=3435 RepID=A0ACC2KSL7_PERAE|nr:hypothetical protein MRB53_032371 [Persea americana]